MNSHPSLVARGERHAVKDEVQAAEYLLATARDILNLIVAADVEREDQRIGEVRRQIADVFFQSLPLIRHGEPCAGVRNRLRDGPRDRPLVGDADDESVFAGKF